MAVTCGVTFNSAVATGINMLGDYHGGAVEGFMELLSDLAGPSMSDEERRSAAAPSSWRASASAASPCLDSVTNFTIAIRGARG